MVILPLKRRFDKRERERRKRRSEICKTLASYEHLCSCAFGTAHLLGGSVVGPAAYLPAYAGFLLEKRLTLLPLSSLTQTPLLGAIVVGGSKVSSELVFLITALSRFRDTLIIGGGMACSLPG